MRFTSFTLSLTVVLSIGTSVYADRKVTSLTVDGGDLPRRNAPVAATITTDPGTSAVWKLVPASGKPVIAQVERTTSGAVVRWIEAELLPGKPKAYELIASDDLEHATLRFVDGDGWRDLAFRDKGVYRHMNAYDPANHAGTFKPFHHVYGMHDEGFITNGPGSSEWGKSGEGIRFPHHRGLFFGYNKTPYGDFWHGTKGVSQRHKQYKADREFVGPIAARESSVNEWTTVEGKPVIRDTREVTTWRIDDATLVLDFDVTLESLTGEPIALGGDAQHAGFHFRAANEVGQEPATQPSAAAAAPGATTRPSTRRGTGGGNAVYTRPAGAVGKGNDVWADCPWVYAAFSIKGYPYGVSEMNGPTNPQPTVFSTRPYGRFGAFVNDQTVAPDKPLKFTYRLIVRDGVEKPDANRLETEYQDWITPVKVTTK
jgi:hypothetical protein